MVGQARDWLSRKARRRPFTLLMLAALPVMGVVWLASYVAMRAHSTEVDAVVTRIEERCGLRASRHYGDVVDGEYMDCTEAQSLLAQSGNAQLGIEHRRILVYSYRSPVDGRTYEGTDTQLVSDDGQPLRPGSHLGVYADTGVPARSVAHFHL